MARDPQILNASAGRFFGYGRREPIDRRGKVVVSIVQTGLKGQPIDQWVITPTEARLTAIKLLQAAEMADMPEDVVE